MISETRSCLGYGDYLRFRDLVLERSGLYFPESKRRDLEKGLFQALAESPLNFSTKSLDEYYELLSDKTDVNGRQEIERLLKALTIGETHFFRNKAQFDALAEQVLPALIARKRAAAVALGSDIQPNLRIWSAGCATGEEPYSLAILLKELIADIDRWHILILATDINQDSLSRARQGIYSDWSFREARAKMLRSLYFSHLPGQKKYQLRDDIRRMVTFAPLNLIEDAYPAVHNNTRSLDLILCRNVTIYFTEDVTRQVVTRLYQSLVDGGWLVMGHSDLSPVIYQPFHIANLSNTILYQKATQSQTIVQPQPPDEIPATAPEPEPSTSSLANNGHQKPVDICQRAEQLLQQGQVEKAITELKQYLVDSPNSVLGYSLLGRIYANQGNWSEARYWCQQALKLNNLIYETYSTLALVYQNENKPEAAIDMFKKAIYLERDLPILHFNLAMLYKNTNQLDHALRSMNNAIRLLEKLSPDRVVPDTAGTTAGQLLATARRILNRLEGSA